MDIPRTITHPVKAQLLGDFGRRHGFGGKEMGIDKVRRKEGSAPPGRSCLFANTSNKHSFISLSVRIR